MKKDRATEFMPMEMKRIILKIRLLSRIKSGKIYSYGLLKEFRDSHFSKMYGPTLKNDIYNTLKALERSNYIKSSSKVSNGKMKNYYTITAGGINAMNSVRKLMMSTVKEADKLFT